MVYAGAPTATSPWTSAGLGKFAASSKRGALSSTPYALANRQDWQAGRARRAEICGPFVALFLCVDDRQPLRALR
jgi:hypothetical protein